MSAESTCRRVTDALAFRPTSAYKVRATTKFEVFEKCQAVEEREMNREEDLS